MNRLTKCGIYTSWNTVPLKRKRILTHAVSWMNVEDIRLTDVSGHKKANSV